MLLVLINGNHGDYPYISIESKRYLATHVVKLLFQGQTIWDEENGDYKFCPGVERSRVDASHLCHKPFCVNPDHVVFESAAKNIARNYCLRRFKCRGHPGSPDCIFFVDAVKFADTLALFKLNGKALKVIFKYRVSIAEAKKLTEKKKNNN